MRKASEKPALWRAHNSLCMAIELFVNRMHAGGGVWWRGAEALSFHAFTLFALLLWMYACVRVGLILSPRSSIDFYFVLDKTEPCTGTDTRQSKRIITKTRVQCKLCAKSAQNCIHFLRALSELQEMRRINGMVARKSNTYKTNCDEFAYERAKQR